MVPLFDPDPVEHPEIPICLAAISPRICETAGEVAEGAARSGRSMDDFAVAVKPLVATGVDEETLAERVRNAHPRIAFYASTPTYRRSFDIHGLTDLTVELAQLSKVHAEKTRRGGSPTTSSIPSNYRYL
jgi:hypothetical protein